jgi:hypothetical protein
MEKELPDEPRTDDGAADQAPVVILPSPNTQGMTGTLQGTTSGIPAISPQPFTESPSATGNDGLASRIEDTLSEDGRFTVLVPGLSIRTADDGTVHLSGPMPSESQRHSLVSAVHAIPGVTSVEDDLRVE